METPPPSASRRLSPPTAADTAAGRAFSRLVAIMQMLRSPEGCPWDHAQTARTLAPYVLEEAYEVVDAIERDDHAGLREELGDHIFEAVFLAQVMAEAGAFTIDDALDSINHKLLRRHPHVFDTGDTPAVETAAQVKAQWDVIKAQERHERGDVRQSVLDGVPVALPALTQAHVIGTRVAAVGFDWPDSASVTAKIREELAEVEETIRGGAREDQVEELGDLLFAVVNLARHLRIDPETALRQANRKFTRRFRAVEARLAAEGKRTDAVSLDVLESHWQAVKHEPASD